MPTWLLWRSRYSWQGLEFRGQGVQLAVCFPAVRFPGSMHAYLCARLWAVQHCAAASVLSDCIMHYGVQACQALLSMSEQCAELPVLPATRPSPAQQPRLPLPACRSSCHKPTNSIPALWLQGR